MPGLVFAGRISYGLYVYHVLVAMLLPRWLPASARFLITTPSLRLMLFGIVTLLVSAISWRFLEQPINRLRSTRTRNARGFASDHEEQAPARQLSWRPGLAQQS